MSIDIFGFRALWSPFYLTILIVISISYFWFIKKCENKFSRSMIAKRQVIYFLLAMTLLYVVKGSPIDLMSHIMFSAHMAQMAILYLVIPPLFIIAIPAWLWRGIIEVNGSYQVVFTWCTKPLFALILFNSLFSVYHIPMVFDFINLNMVLHSAYMVLLFIAAIFMWFPLVNQLSERDSLSGVGKISYIFGSGVLMTPACALIIFANAPMYSTFTNPDSWANVMRLCVPNSTLSGLNVSGPELFSGIPALEDQQLGGVLMKITQEIVLGYVLGVLFFTWYKKENGRDMIDPLPTDEKTIE